MNAGAQLALQNRQRQRFQFPHESAVFFWKLRAFFVAGFGFRVWRQVETLHLFFIKRDLHESDFLAQYMMILVSTWLNLLVKIGN